MATQTLQIIDLKQPGLANLSEIEKMFLLVGCHAQNELGLLNKLFVWAIPRPGEADGFDVPMNSQALILAKLFAGKMLEAWGCVEKAYFATKLSKVLAGSIDGETRDALNDLKKYFGISRCAIRIVRDEFAFHYDVNQIANAWAQAAKEPSFHLLLGGTYGNTFYLAAENAANIAMFNAIVPGDLKAAMSKFYDDIDFVRKRFSEFFEGIVATILKRHVGDDMLALARTQELEIDTKFVDVRIPLFTVMPDK